MPEAPPLIVEANWCEVQGTNCQLASPLLLWLSSLTAKLPLTVPRLPMPNHFLLVVDDDPIQREGLAALLRSEGYTVSVAADGLEAMEHLGKVPTDLVLLDMIMPPPTLDGWRFLALWKRLAAITSIPILIITGLDIATHEWAVSLGAAGCVKKPVDVALLLAEVRRCCELPPV